MKTEKEKMLSNELYNHKDAELTKERNHAYELTLRYNQTKDDETELRTSILQQLAGKLGNNVVIKPPFQCDYGYNLILGDNVFMNYGCSILDCNVVEIGNNVLMAPNVQIYAAYHPTDHTLRLKDLEYADRVKIGDNTWIGGGSIILNGVTIGKNTVIGAGSVVTKDIPDNVVAVGNPCRVIKRLDKENVENGKRLKFTDFAHINIVVDDIDEGIKYYEQLLEAKPIQIFREFSNIGFAKAAGFLEHPELVKLSIAFMEIPGTKLTLELMEYYEPVTTDAKHREDVNKINGVRHVALEIQNIDEAFKYIKTYPDITLINPSEQYGPYKIDDITADEVQFFEADMEADGNSFYPNVKNVQEFIVKSNKLLKKSRPTYIDATCSTQVLFPMISILGKALSGFHTWKLQTIDSVNSKFPFKVLSGEIRGIPAIVKIQNQLDPKDPDNNGFLLHRIVLGTTEGSLCLDNSNGLVIWNPQMYVPHAEGVLDMYGNNSYVELPVSEVADGVRNTTYAEVYKELWPEGIVCALNDFARAITDNSQKNIMAQQMLTISEIWKDLSEKIGSPQLIVTPERNGIRLADIAE